MVTYSFTQNGQSSTSEHATLIEAFTAVRADLGANAGKVPVSVDDHEGNFYDAEYLNSLGMATDG